MYLRLVLPLKGNSEEEVKSRSKARHARYVPKPDEDLKDFLRLGFAYGGLDTALSDTFEECALLIRRYGFTAFLEILESAEQELLRPPG
jgi:hypothetical protein